MNRESKLISLCYKYLVANCDWDGIAKADLHGEICELLVTMLYPKEDELFISYYSRRVREESRNITDYLNKYLDYDFGFRAIPPSLLREKAKELAEMLKQIAQQRIIKTNVPHQQP